MKVKDLIAELQKLPQECDVQVNDECGGEIHEIEHVLHFPADEYDSEVVMVHVNCV